MDVQGWQVHVQGQSVLERSPKLSADFKPMRFNTPVDSVGLRARGLGVMTSP